MVSQFAQQIPTFGGADRKAVQDETRRQCAANVRLFLEVVRTERSVKGSELPFLPDQQWVRVGIPLEDALQAFRIGHRCLWDAIRASATEIPGGEEAALALARPLMDFIDAVSSAVAYAYLQAEHALVADQDQSRRELLESILAGRLPLTGASRAQALAEGLEPSAAYLLIVGRIAGGASHATRQQVIRAIRDRVERDCSGLLLVDRGDEVVGLLAPRSHDLRALHNGLKAAIGRLHESRDIVVTLGMSTTLDGLDSARIGYREAARAVSWVASSPGIIALPLVSVLDYLVAAADDTARRIPSPADPLLTGEPARLEGMRETLQAYFAGNLNVRKAAARLEIHPNTMHYRLRRITEASGADLHDFGTLVELLVALRLREPLRSPAEERDL